MTPIDREMLLTLVVGFAFCAVVIVAVLP